MTEYEAYQEHIRYTHDTYCRIVIRHASFDAARMLAARWKREISLEYLIEEKFVQLSTTDEYFQVPDYGETYPFSVRGQTILLDSCSLAAALARLPEQTQEEMILAGLELIYIGIMWASFLLIPVGFIMAVIGFFSKDS